MTCLFGPISRLAADSPGHRRRSGPATSGVCARPTAVLAAHRADARRGPVPGGQGASRWLLPGGQRGLSAAAAGARRPDQGQRRLAACPQTWPAVPPASAVAPGTPARCLAARVWRRPTSAAGARTVSQSMPATGSGRDAMPGPAPDDRPAPPPGPPGVGMIPAQPSPAPSPPWPGSDGLPRASPELSAWPGGTGAGGLPGPPAGSR